MLTVEEKAAEAQPPVEAIKPDPTPSPLARPGALRFVLVISAIALGVLGQIFVSQGNIRWAITPYAVAILAMALAVSRMPLTAFNPRRDDSEAKPEPVASRSQLQRKERRWGITGLLLAALFLGFSLFQFPKGPPNTEAWYLYGLSMILLFLAMPAFGGTWSAFVDRFQRRPQVAINLRSVLTWAILGLVLIFALLIRIYNLDELPVGFWFDEADNLMHANRIRENPGSAPVFATTLPALYLLPVAALIGLIDLTPVAIRLVSVMFSLAGIVAVFLLARLLMGPFVGLVTAFVMAVMRWDLNFSRIGMHPATMTLFTALTVYLTLKAVRGGRYTGYGFAGAALGLGMWFYASFRLFPLVLAVILIHYAISQRPRVRGFLTRIAFLGFVALIVASPVIQFAARDPGEFFSRTRTSSVFSIMPAEQAIGEVKNGIIKHLLMFHIQGDPNPRHNLPDAPMLDFMTGMLVLLGLGLVVARWRSIGLLLLPFWIFFMILPGALTLPWEAPQALRAIGVTPAVALLAALPIGAVWWIGRSAPWRSARRATPVIVALLLAVMAYGNINTYFGEQADDPKVFAAFTTDETLIGRHMRDQQSRGYSLLTSRQFKFSIGINLGANGAQYEVIRAPINIPLDAGQVWQGAAIYLEPREASFYRLLRVYYPDAQFEEIRAPAGGDPIFYIALISRQQLSARQGLLARYILQDNSVIEGVTDSSESVWFLNDELVGRDFSMTWDGVLHVTQPGQYLLALEGDTDAQVFLDGVNILSSDRTSISIVPAVGLHTLEVEGSVTSDSQSLRLLWQPPDGSLEPIPVSNLYHGSVRPLGLSGRFYEDGQRDESASDASRVTPALDTFWYDPVLSEPYEAVWDGTLNTTAVGGDYRFKVGAFGDLSLFIDDDLIAAHPGLPEGEVTLDSGLHKIRVEYISQSPPSQFEILWAIGNSPFEPLPIERLIPAKQHMFRPVP